ncbi:hypothetical protein MAFF212519_12550 [Clavibacter michiganensis]
MRIADFPVPDTVAARGAIELATSYQSAAITAHGIRSWLWAEAFAVVEGLAEVDHEILYVSAVLHDIGTVTEFDNHTVSYEHAGGHVGVALTAGAGWPAARRQRVLDAIVRHNWPSVDPELDVEGHLLEVGTGLDISGARPDALPEEFLREVLAAHRAGARRRVRRVRARPGGAEARHGRPPPRRRRPRAEARGEPAGAARMSGRIRMTALLAVAALAVVGGALALVWSLLQPVSLGFFAYAPESGETFTTPGVHILASGSLVAAGVLALGLVGLAFWAGIRVGGRRARHEPDAS